MTQTITDIYQQLRRDEGVKHEMYMDTTGNLSIGVGHNLRARGLSEAAVEQILRDDVADIRQELLDTHPWITRLSVPRQGVCLNMAFNLGVPGFGTFKNMKTAMQTEQWEHAARHMLDSKYAKQVGDRAQRLARQLVTNEWV